MKKKIIVETNWWVSFILSRHSGNLPHFFFDEMYDFYFSTELLIEINDTLNYSRIKKRINKTNLKKFSAYIREFAAIIETSSLINICRDPKDNFLLALAKEAGADFLITRDEDLLVLKNLKIHLLLPCHNFLK